MALDSVTINSEVLNDTVIGAQTKFKGTVNTERRICIDGIFEGTINSTVDVVVGPTGLFDGTITCATLVIAGEVRGDVKCTQLMKFDAAGRFKGDAVTAAVDMKPEHTFEGGLKIAR